MSADSKSYESMNMNNVRWETSRTFRNKGQHLKANICNLKRTVKMKYAMLVEKPRRNLLKDEANILHADSQK